MASCLAPCCSYLLTSTRDGARERGEFGTLLKRKKRRGGLRIWREGWWVTCDCEGRGVIRHMEMSEISEGSLVTRYIDDKQPLPPSAARYSLHH
jgi:hypothetical protein